MESKPSIPSLPSSVDIGESSPQRLNRRFPSYRVFFNQTPLSPEITHHEYRGSGTEEDPYLVNWLPNDVQNPMNFSDRAKWGLALLMAFPLFALSLASSAYTGSIPDLSRAFHASSEVTLLGVSLFVLGFAVGPLLWAPASERYGRRYVCIASSAALTITAAGAAGARNIETVLILRFLGGSLGAAPLSITPGVVSDVFHSASRGFALGVSVVTVFLSPPLGPVVGGFIAQGGGWPWVQGALAIVSGVQLLAVVVLLPETYAPVLLNRRATQLSRLTGRVFRSSLHSSRQASLGVTLCRPWVLLLREPIVLLISFYVAIVYGTLYMTFAAYPIIFQEERGWGPGLGGLSFLGITIGVALSLPYMFWCDTRYQKKIAAHKTSTSHTGGGGGDLPPETRLPDTFPASIALCIGLFWFAWSNSPAVHWIVPILAGVPFGFGMVMLFIPFWNYLVDAYTIYAASVLAANSVLRSTFAAVFPLFTRKMYAGLGLHWAASVPAFLALVCVPIPYLFYFYGARIRKRCRYAAESEVIRNPQMSSIEETTV